MNILITGSSGFIGGHLTRYLQGKGHFVVGIDWKPPKYFEPDKFILGDLRNYETAEKSMIGIDQIYHLAADMGGIGFIQDPKNHFKIIYNNNLINLNVFEAARRLLIDKILYSSSACIYPLYKQKNTDVKLKEEDAYPAEPEDTYGWEKLHAEHLAKAFNQKFNMDIKIVRFHNIYGPYGEYTGGREKAPAAICRKVAEAIKNNKKEIEVWGDGLQTRSFCYIDDCIKAIEMVMNSDLSEPINIGRDDLISVNDMAKIILGFESEDIKIKNIPGWLGVRGRNSDNTKFKEKFNWEPNIDMENGLKKTYDWIKKNG